MELAADVVVVNPAPSNDLLEELLATQREHTRMLKIIMAHLQGDDTKQLVEANRILKIENEELQEENTILRRRLDTTN